MINKAYSKLCLGLFLLFICLQSSSQTINKTFTSGWAMTFWTFNFYKDGTYSRTSQGHYGNTKVVGKYKVNKDTIQILSGFQNTDGTVNEFYLLKDDRIIDLKLLYDYILVKNKKAFPYASKKRTGIR